MGRWSHIRKMDRTHVRFLHTGVFRTRISRYDIEENLQILLRRKRIFQEKYGLCYVKFM